MAIGVLTGKMGRPSSSYGQVKCCLGPAFVWALREDGGGVVLQRQRGARTSAQALKKGVTKYAFPRNWSKYPDCALKAGSKRSCIFSRAGQSWGFADGGWRQWLPRLVIGRIDVLNPGQTRLRH